MIRCNHSSVNQAWNLRASICELRRARQCRGVLELASRAGDGYVSHRGVECIRATSGQRARLAPIGIRARTFREFFGRPNLRVNRKARKVNLRQDFNVLRRRRPVLIVNIDRNGDPLKRFIGRDLFDVAVILGDLIVVRVVTYRIHGGTSNGFRT